MKKILSVCLLVLLLTAALSLSVFAAVDLNSPAYVVDDAGVLSPDTESLIIGINQMLEQNCQGAQFCVVTVKYAPSGMDHEEFAKEIFDTWHIGASGEDNGALLVVYTEDDDFWLEMGYGAYNNPYIDEVADMVSDSSTFYRNILNDKDDAAVASLTEELGSWYKSCYGTSSYNYSPSQSGYAGSGYTETSSNGSALLGLLIILLLVIICTSPRRCQRRWGHWGLWPFFYFSTWWPTRVRMPRGSFWTTSYPMNHSYYRSSPPNTYHHSSGHTTSSFHSGSSGGFGGGHSSGGGFHGGGGHSGGGFHGGGGHSGGGFGHR